MGKIQVLITGGNRFLGKLLRLKLENTNFSIVATGLGVDRLFNHNHIYVELDIRSKKRCEYVLNKLHIWKNQKNYLPLRQLGVLCL